MKNVTLFISIGVILLISCIEKNNSTKENITQNISAPKLTFFVNQLFLFQEAIEPRACKSDVVISGDSVLAGAMYITNKGNIILNTLNQQSDTQSYFWGKYRLTDTTLTYFLTDEYYYQGKWDARWDVDDPDYSKGKTRKVKSAEVTLFRTKCDSLTFFRLYNKEELTRSAKRHINAKPGGLGFWRYYETENMKFYTWFYKQIPVLCDL